MKIIAAMSGGVDSSVAAVSLLREGHEVLGVHLRMRAPELAAESNCVNPQHEHDARAVAERAGIPFQTIDMCEAFELHVAQPFMRAYQRGETPNPCVMCNLRVKLGPLVEWALANGYDAIATGHYARITRDEPTGRWQLRRGITRAKDQSYYLCALRQEHLAHLVLPLGELEKSETRAMAQRWGLAVAQKRDSQDICMVAADGNYRAYMARRLGAESLGAPGPILTTTGESIGRHHGLGNYTIGQRKGIGIGYAHPLYVVALDIEHNTLIVGPNEELYRRSLHVTDVNWSSMAPPETGACFPAQVQVRYQHKPARAEIRVLEPQRIEIEFEEPQRAIAPGQIAALYDEDLLLAGGTIQR